MCIYKLPTTIIGHERQPTVFPSFNRVHYDTFDHIKKLFLSAIYETQSARLPPLPAAAVSLVLSFAFAVAAAADVTITTRVANPVGYFVSSKSRATGSAAVFFL